MTRNAYVIGLLIASFGLLGGGCSRSVSVGSPLTTVTTTRTTSSLTTADVLVSPTSSPTSTFVSLVDRPVSEWPRYEFKELGFSMQLPFKNLERLGGLQDCTQPEGRCDNPSSHNYTLSLSVWATTSPVFISVLAKTPEFTFDGYLTPFATSSLLRSATGIYHFKNLKLIQTLVRNGRTLSLYEGGVGFFYEWEDDPPQLRTILIPLKKSVFPVAVVILNEQEVRPAIIAEIFRSTSFLP